MAENTKKAYILLADGTVLTGEGFGAEGTAIGEIVFDTAMTGYQEMLTDPSFYGQIVTQTYPLAGNYGVNEIDYDSRKAWASGYIVREWCESPSNFRCQGDIDGFLKEQNVVAISGIDTRALTRKIRECGVMNGMITTEDVYADMESNLKKVKEYVIKDAVKAVCRGEVFAKASVRHSFKVVLIDCGYKNSILRSLTKRGCDVVVVPYNTPVAEILRRKPDGIMITNGPGDPAENTEVIETIKELAKTDVPMFGIGLGHQLMALASGGKTEKLKYGHRGANQPVKELATGRTYVTSQNHGYAVDGASIASAGEVSHINANDNTCEGIRYKNGKDFSVQFYPETFTGLSDAPDLFDMFIDLMSSYKKKRDDKQ